MFPEWFPVEEVPDGAVFIAHHYNYLLLMALLAAFTVWDDYRDKEPVVVVAGVLLGLFSFLFMWPNYGYHQLGAALAVSLPLVSMLVIVSPWSSWRLLPRQVERPYPMRASWAVLLLTMAGWEDALQHAFGVATPLDTLFKMYGVEGSFLIIFASGCLFAAVFTGWDRLRRRFGRSPTG